MADAMSAASGRWPELLQSIGGLSAEQLTDEHQPCPACGGTDRYRWDRDDGPGGWFCNQCGGKDHAGGAGSGVDLLMRVRGWSLSEACQAVERHLGLPAATSSKKRSKPHRAPSKPPADAAPPRQGNATAQWCYRDAAGEQLFWIQRLDIDGRKVFVHRTWLDGAWHYPSRRDAFTCEWPAPRPLYRLPDLAARPDAPVMVVEGEKAADAAAQLLPLWVVVSWPNGCKAIAQIDWQPLAGRAVTLWPDADDPGRLAMATLAARLLPLGCEVQVVQPKAGLAPGWDLADALAEGWTERQVLAVMARFAKRVEAPEVEQKPESKAEVAPKAEVKISPEHRAALEGPAPFTCLGFDDGAYYYQPAETGQVIRLLAGSHSRTQLLRLADVHYWQACHPSKSGWDVDGAVSRLFRDQAQVGVYDPGRIRGRGAWWDQGRSVLHLGDRLIVDGVAYPVTAPHASRFNYQRLASLDIPDGLDPLNDDEGLGLLSIAGQFLWEVPASGLLMAGWVALAPICGSLSWRPHAWLTASAGSGKSALIDRFVGTLLDQFAHWPEGNTTEAYIRQTLRADAMPVVFDEAESNERADRERIQNILALARVASSSGRGVIGKGGADGAAQRFTIRSMFLLCSISTALKQGADQSRFAQLTLRNPSNLPKPERQAHWNQLDRELTTNVTAQVGHRLLLRMVGLIPVIRQSVAVFRRAAADRFDSQRQGDQYGTLLAGAWALQSSTVPTEAEAYSLIDSQDWQPYRDASEQPDELRCIQMLLQAQLRVEGDRGNAYYRSVGELVEMARPDAVEKPGQVVTADAAIAQLGRIGIRVDGDQLLISNTAEGIRRILADTAWAHSWPTVLGRLRGATKAGVTRFRGLGGVSRAVSVPIDLL
jgi:putative DNA primase/helicase